MAIAMAVAVAVAWNGRDTLQCERRAFHGD